MSTAPFTKYSFAKQYLDAKRAEIFMDGQRILKYAGIPRHPLQKISTSIQIGDSLIDGSMIIELSYVELLRLGFCIISQIPLQPWLPAQRVMYKITKYQEGMPHLGDIPKGSNEHYVLYAPLKKALQLIGAKADPSGYGPILYIDNYHKAREPSANRDINKYFSEDSTMSVYDQQMKHRIKGLDFGPKFVDVPEIPIIFSVETNEIVCIPVDVVDIPKIGCVGKTGCVSKNTLLYVRQDYIEKKMKISDLPMYPHDIDVVSTDKYGELSWKRVFKAFSKGMQKPLRVWVEGAGHIDATPDHLFFKKNEQEELIDIPLSKLRVGDTVPVKKKNLNLNNQRRITPWIIWREITKIEELPEEEVWDIQVEDNDSFMLNNGIIVHNSGKTYGAHSIIDQIKWKTTHEIAILNDNSNQSFMWTLPNKSGMQADYLAKLGETPRALPIVPLYPTSDDMTDDDVLLGNEISQKISMNFSDVVDNFDYFFQGREIWKLGASDKWFRQCKDKIRNATSLEEIEEILVGEIGHIKGLKPTIGKILSIFRDMFDLNFTDISSGVPSEWEFKVPFNNEEFKMNPVLGLMRTGCIPALITTNLGRKDYYPNYERYYLDSIYDAQINRNKPVWILVDEVGNIYKKGNKKTVAADSFIKACTEGRQRQLGLIYTIQNYSKLDEEVRNNTNYLISCIYSDSKEINLISKDFNLETKKKNELSTLKNHEVIVMSNDKPLVIYTFDGERREETGVAYKGFSVPCLSEHRRPGTEL